MKVLFIYTCHEEYRQDKPLLAQYMPLGISYISSLLKVHGHQTEALVLTRMTKKHILDQFITQFQPDIIGFSAVTTEYPFIKKTAEYIKKKYPHLYLIIGGVHPSLVPKQVIVGSFDALCIGEGEYPTLELVQQLEQGKTPRNIPNLWIKTGTGIEKNPPRPFIQDLDSLPFPDREIWQKWIAHPKTRLRVLVGRGCPFNCTYCANHALRKVSAGKYYRLRSINNIIQELEEVVTKFPEVKEYSPYIDTMGVNFKYDIELCSALENFNTQRQKSVSFIMAVLRIVPNKDFTPLFHALKKANCNELVLGLESGSERIRKNILRRHYSNADFIRVVRLAKQLGFKIHILSMIGLPSETQADFKETVRLNRICMPEILVLSIFFPYPGTKLFEICKDMDLLPPRLDTRFERRIPVLGLPGFSKKQIQREYRRFWYNVYYGNRPFYALLYLILEARVMSSPVFITIVAKNKLVGYILTETRSIWQKYHINRQLYKKKKFSI